MDVRARRTGLLVIIILFSVSVTHSFMHALQLVNCGFIFVGAVTADAAGLIVNSRDLVNGFDSYFWVESHFWWLRPCYEMVSLLAGWILCKRCGFKWIGLGGCSGGIATRNPSPYRSLISYTCAAIRVIYLQLTALFAGQCCAVRMDGNVPFNRPTQTIFFLLPDPQVNK